VDDSEAQAPYPRKNPQGLNVLVVSADDDVVVVAPGVARSSVESEQLHSIEDLLARVDRSDARVPEVVFLDLDLCESREREIVLLVRRRFPLASVVAIAGDLDGERSAQLLTLGVPSLQKPVSAAALGDVAAKLPRVDTADPEANPASSQPGSGRLEALLEAYSSERGLSPQQRLILGLHLTGNNDKEIASSCSCSEATVYEHWRRMARKAGGLHKSCVINDFHKFLDR
jgi:DNA-binding NarL/FixJ family response regulator